MANRTLKERAETLRQEINTRFAHGNKHRLKTVEALEIMARCDGERNRHAALLAGTALTPDAKTDMTAAVAPTTEATERRYDVVPAGQVMAGDRLDLSHDRELTAGPDAPDLADVVAIPMRPADEELGLTGRIDGTRHLFGLNLRIEGDPAAAQDVLDSFREATVPSENHGVTIWNMTTTERPEWYEADVEVRANGRGAARRAFECFEDETSEEQNHHGITIGTLGTPRTPARQIVHLAIAGIGIVGFDADHPMRRLRTDGQTKAHGNQANRRFTLELDPIANGETAVADNRMDLFLRTQAKAADNAITFGDPSRIGPGTQTGTTAYRLTATVEAPTENAAEERFTAFMKAVGAYRSWGIALRPDFASLRAADDAAPEPGAASEPTDPEPTTIGETTPVAVDDIRVGDRLDLEGDPYADPQGENTLLECEYAEVTSVEHETTGTTRTVAIGIEGFDVVGFPSGHQVKRRKYEPVTLEKPERTVGLVINAPSVFERPDFMTWLDDPKRNNATWHVKGRDANDYSDTYVLVDSNYDGDSSDMPEDIWRTICDAVYQTYCDGSPELRGTNGYTVVVRLTNLP